MPARLYAVRLSLDRTKEGLRWALFALVASVWLGWFVLLSTGWPRYAFLPLTVTSVFVAQLFYELTEGYSLSLRDFWERSRAGNRNPALAGRTALTVLLLLIILRSLQGRFRDVLVMGEDTPHRMAAYIETYVPPDAEIETYDPEMCFLSGHNCHLPPNWVMDAAIKYVWYNAPPPSEYYDFREYGAPYLLVGDFGRWVHLYDLERAECDYELEISLGGYELYRVKEGE